MSDVEKRLDVLEKRIAALEVEVQKRHGSDVKEIARQVTEKITAELTSSIDHSSVGAFDDTPE